MCTQYILKMDTMCYLSDDYDLGLVQVDLKGCIRGGARRTVACSDERCEQDRPSGPHTPSERASRNVFTKAELADIITDICINQLAQNSFLFIYLFVLFVCWCTALHRALSDV